MSSIDDTRPIARPQPGYWLVRLVAGGPEVPAAIVYEQTLHEPDEPDNLMDRSPQLVAYLAGKVVKIAEVWERRGRPIDAAEYAYQLADLTWAQRHAPGEPKATPHRPINLTIAPPPSFD